MAFTAVHYPTDKDQNQAPYWPENEELGVASDNNFFEQFLAFDSSEPSALGGGNDLLANPPSPSILLENLDADLSNPSTDQDTQSGQSRSETSGSSISLDFSSIPSLEQSKSVPLELAAPLISDPILSNGSISDSELLRLEGISRLSIESPKRNATAPQGSPLANQGSLSPRKHSRVLNSFCSALRRATHWSKSHKPQEPPMEVSTAIMGDPLKTEDSVCYDLPVDFDLSGLGDVKLEETSISNNLPLSPPLTGRIPADHNSDDIMNFVSGHFDDPFCDDVLAPPAIIDSVGKGHDIDLNTPMTTPALDDDIFYQQTLDLIGSNGTSLHQQKPQPKLRSTSSAEWPMEGILNNDSQNGIWPTSSSPGAGPAYASDSGGGISSPGWWDTPQQVNGHRHHGGRSHSHSHSHSHSSGSIHNNVSLNLSMHNQQAELPYEYSTGADMSGLMIHMPQPRTPQAAVLSSNMNDPLIMPSPSSAYYHPPPHSGSRRNSSGPSQYHHGHHSEHRRPRPRAPSSGARHYGSSNPYGGPMTSPRKVSSSAACYTLREESMSPTPLPRQRTSSSSSSSSLALRKQRSWSRQHRKGGEPRTPSSGRVRSSSCRSAGYDPSGGGGGGGGSLSIEFCNYTPSDKKVLMNGVAPSGSSKTKARREREAQEKNEKYVEAIRAAGVDVEKLRQNGFLFTK
ncbi:uncharacterized protein F4817DRAFT_251716 [Daldinia loculata]|uniref:uncharacterized protein n=1 Tax=Daldinia loculata TaxID=103429 RepID=UPI0020C26F91|nr:uncharacterized protein F4817DRAFT_251716 [Daldinia loculata]KAI1643515.1 hypothetical protein F4817DRAFT_251716 [Daldinia loculata]